MIESPQAKTISIKVIILRHLESEIDNEIGLLGLKKGGQKGGGG
jgi:hypothetical protein